MRQFGQIHKTSALGIFVNLAEKEEREKVIGLPFTWDNKGQELPISTPSINYKNLNNPAEPKVVQEYLGDM